MVPTLMATEGIAKDSAARTISGRQGLATPQGSNVDAQNWREIEKDLELYKFYVEFLLKATAFACTLTGVIVSFYLAHAKAVLHIAWSLLVPILINGGFMSLCLGSIAPARNLQAEHARLCRGSGMSRAYNLELLPKLLMTISVTFALITCGLVILLCMDANYAR